MYRHRRRPTDWIELANKPHLVRHSSPRNRIGVVIALAAVLLGPGIAYSIVHHSFVSPMVHLGSGPTVSQGKGAASPPVPTSAAPEPPSTTTLPVARILVLVANGSDHAGAAGRTTSAVTGLGYQVAPATNATVSVPETTIYFLPGDGAEASTLGAALTNRLGAMPVVATMPPSPPVGSLAGAQLLVVLGANEEI